MINVAGYCRVSTDKEDQLNSFETQKGYFYEYIQNHPEWQLYKIYADEGRTGTSTKRRISFNRMIRDAYDGRFEMIITKEVSRFSRNILDTIRYTRELRDIGVGVLFLNDRINTLDPESEMLLSFLASLAQEESRRTSSRIVWGQTRQMEKGVVFGHGLLGYHVENGVLKTDEKGAEIVRLIFQKYAVEQMGTSEIAKVLMRKGYCTYSGNKQWKSNTIIKILNNEKYIGNLVQKKTYTTDFLTHKKQKNKGEMPFIIVENHHEPIISREVWDMAQSRLRRNNKHGNGGAGHSNRYVFSGKIKCGECGSNFVGRFRYLKDGTKIRRWRCGTASIEGTAACNIGRLLRDDDALQMFKVAIRNLPMDVKFIMDNVTELAVNSIQIGSNPVTEIRRLQLLKQRVQQKREMLMDSYFSEEITKEDMISIKQKYDREIDDICQRLLAAKSKEKEELDSDSLRSSIQTQISHILNGDVESESFCKTMVDHLTVYKDRHIELHLQHLPHIFYFSE